MADTGFQRPALADIITRIEADFNSRLPGADSRLRRSLLSVLARVMGGVAHLLYGYLDFIIRQVFPDSAISTYLLRLASIWQVIQKAATKASGTATLNGTNGSAVNSGEILQRGDGVEFVTTNAVTISGGTATVNVEAKEAGANGNTVNGTILTFISPISGVNAQATAGDLTGGADTEGDDSLRTRLLTRLQQPPHGGNENDYIEWALEVPGVTRAWLYPKEDGPGSVRLRFMMDDTYGNGIPLGGDVSTVKAYIDALRPVTAELFVSAPTAVSLNFTITLKDEDGNTVSDPTVRAAVQAELEDLLRRMAKPKADGTVNLKPDGKIPFSQIRQAISNAAGEYDHQITVPSADVTPSSVGQIYVMGSMTWL